MFYDAKLVKIGLKLRTVVMFKYYPPIFKDATILNT